LKDKRKPMPAPIIIVEKPADFRWAGAQYRIMTLEDYLKTGLDGAGHRRKLVNFCRDYSYLGAGYYCSLLAEARGDRVTPGLDDLLELGQRQHYAHRIGELNRLLEPPADLPRSIDSFAVHSYFGRVEDAGFARLAARAFELFRCPLMEITCERAGEGSWQIAAIKPLDPRQVPPERDRLFLDALESFTHRLWRRARPGIAARLDLAILHDPKDPLPPSRRETLEHMGRIAETMGIATHLIEKRDFARLTQFDALFIRETTAVPHHTFRFAKQAERAGMPVIDDPASILRCTNKVFLAELLRGHGLPTPRTSLVTKRTLDRFAERFDQPVVLKIPDGSFSQGVKRATSADEFGQIARDMLRQSEIILAQEFMYTPFDWRIGVLAGKAIFAARYFMCDQHWQILQHGADGSHVEGRTQAVAIGAVPAAVRDMAVAAARLIGDGFYGVDLKETEAGVFIIEINDNPNLDQGMEDRAAGDAVYRALLDRFVTLFEQRAGRGPAPPTSGCEMIRFPVAAQPKPANLLPFRPLAGDRH
jgi:glutathione synthase/RimK-type ligase-like ATP-grasp enzyme